MQQVEEIPSRTPTAGKEAPKVEWRSFLTTIKKDIPFNKIWENIRKI